MRNKLGQTDGTSVLISMIIFFVITGVAVYLALNIPFADMRDDFCIEMGYNESTDYSRSNDRYSRAWDIECDNSKIYWNVWERETCLEHDKFNDCVNEKTILVG